MNFSRLINNLQQHGVRLVEQLAGEARLLVDLSQLNRRTRSAWRQGRTTRAWYLLADHQRRRISRRREIRQFVEGQFVEG